MPGVPDVDLGASCHVFTNNGERCHQVLSEAFAVCMTLASVYWSVRSVLKSKRIWAEAVLNKWLRREVCSNIDEREREMRDV